MPLSMPVRPVVPENSLRPYSPQPDGSYLGAEDAERISVYDAHAVVGGAKTLQIVDIDKVLGGATNQLKLEMPVIVGGTTSQPLWSLYDRSYPKVDNVNRIRVRDTGIAHALAVRSRNICHTFTLKTGGHVPHPNSGQSTVLTECPASIEDYSGPCIAALIWSE